MKLLGNLDCEARWAGVPLPETVRRRISLYATLFAACALGGSGDRHDVWVPAAVDPTRLLASPGWVPPTVHTVAGGRFDLAWADPVAAAANDRSRTLAIAEALGVALPGAQVVGSLDELDAAVARFAGGGWVCKARWTSAGRDRARGAGRPEGELRTRLARMLERFGPLVLEPWLDRIADFGVCGEIVGGDIAGREVVGGEVAGGRVAGDAAPRIQLLPPHRLRTDTRGGFLGIDLSPVEPAIAEALHATAQAAAARLAADTGHRGPFAIDAFVYRHHGGAERLHPLCELNARYSFGWIAHGLARRLGIRRLGFDAAPAGATLLITPGDDGVTAWCA